MFRFLLFLGLFFLLGFKALNILHRENLKAVGIQELEAGNLKKAISVLELWVQEEPGSDLAYFFLGKAFLQNFLKDGSPEDLQKAELSFQDSVRRFDRNPETYYWWANLAKVSARMEGDSEGYLLYVKRMRRACELDPKNYYYYSIYFETLMGFLTDFSYLRSPLEKKVLEKEISFALLNYLKLKSYYQKEYLALLGAHFSGETKKRILSGDFGKE